jgi:hypothetical protein
MKKIMVITILFVSTNLSAQNNNDADTATKAVISEIGKPNGKISEKIINQEGDTLISGDGNLELIVPPGALSKNTTISIQPITNLMPNGNGQAYRLKPSGIQFQQPIKIVFHYNPEESEDSAQLLMGIAMQDDKGQWYGLNEFTLDTVTKTISGNINHFSIWATFDQLKLKTLMGENRLKVKKSVLVSIWGVFMGGREEINSRGLSKLKTMKPPQKAIWYVDGAIKGNSYVGTLEKGRVDESEAKWNYYTAPDNIPDDNPVTISVDLVWESYTSNGKTVKYRELNTKILIYDNAYEVEIVSKQEGYNFSYLDEGSFVVSLEGKTGRLLETKNKNSTDKLEFTAKGCVSKIINRGVNSGHIHITGVNWIKVTPAEPPNFPYVDISFILKPMVYSTFRITCTDKSGKKFTATTDPATAKVAASYAYPYSVRFFAKEGEQVIEDSDVPGGHYKVTVRKLKDD